MLSPRLYKALQKMFGKVQVHSPGEKITDYSRGSWLSVNRKIEIKGGERYSVTCPECLRKGKLWLSYKVQDTPKGKIIRGKGYVNCFRCNFQKDPRKLNRFLINLGSVVGSGATVEKLQIVEEEKPRDERDPPVAFPITDKDCLIFQNYLISRGLDPKELEEDWGVTCSADPRWFSTPRLLIPITLAGSQVGWQARHLNTEDTEGEEKYLFPPGFSKTQWLYNQDRALYAARKEGCVIICEGVFDVFKCGSHAICIFGKEASNTQIKKLCAIFKGLEVVILLDNEKGARDKASELKLKLQSKGCFSKVRDLCFEDGDPGDKTREEIDKLIRGTR